MYILRLVVVHLKVLLLCSLGHVLHPLCWQGWIRCGRESGLLVGIISCLMLSTSKADLVMICPMFLILLYAVMGLARDINSVAWFLARSGRCFVSDFFGLGLLPLYLMMNG